MPPTLASSRRERAAAASRLEAARASERRLRDLAAQIAIGLAASTAEVVAAEQALRRLDEETL